jgi:LmbE family N-acetylglucosaminyl deacetylase
MTAILLALILFIAAGGGWVRVRRYQKWFHLPTHRADKFRCCGSQHTTAVQVGVEGFDLPTGLDLMGRTVFLQVIIKSSLLGRLLDPYIEIQAGQPAYRQYFERGAGGSRSVNLSPLFQSNTQATIQHVRLRGSCISWERAASLVAYNPPIIDGASVLVLAPHPDDAEIAAFGMYRDRRSWVVTVTAGERATGNLPQNIPTTARAGWAARLRVIDSLTVPQLGQVPPDRRLNLAYPDGTLESMHREPLQAFSLACEDSLSRGQLRSQNNRPEFRTGSPGCTWNDLVGELRLLLELSQPDIIVCPHPLIDTHSDHIFTTVALERAMRSIEGKRPMLFLYVVHNRGAPSYPFGPAESLVSLPPGGYDGWVADSIHSLPLEPEIRQSKFFAVEAMHAVRRYDDGAPRDSLKFLKSVRREFTAFIAGMSLEPASFLRRAPRPNEVSYIVRGEALPELIERIPNIRSASP